MAPNGICAATSFLERTVLPKFDAMFFSVWMMFSRVCRCAGIKSILTKQTSESTAHGETILVADDETAMRQIETEAWLLPSDRHGTEASFVPHHPSVNFGSICQRNGFDHWTDSLQGQESVSSASFAGPVIVPAIERMP